MQASDDLTRPVDADVDQDTERTVGKQVSRPQSIKMAYTEEMFLMEKVVGKYSQDLLVHHKLPEETVIKDNKIVLQNQVINSLVHKQLLDSPFIMVDVVFLREEQEIPPGMKEVYRSRQGLFEYEGQYRWCAVKISKIPDQPLGTKPYLRVAAFDMESGNIERFIGVGWSCLADIKMVGNLQIDLMADDQLTANFECRVQLEDGDIFAEW